MPWPDKLRHETPQNDTISSRLLHALQYPLQRADLEGRSRVPSSCEGITISNDSAGLNLWGQNVASIWEGECAGLIFPGAPGITLAG